MKAIIVVTYDDVNAYFLVINSDERKVIKRYDAWRYDDHYDEDALVRQIAKDNGITDYKVIHWLE